MFRDQFVGIYTTLSSANRSRAGLSDAVRYAVARIRLRFRSVDGGKLLAVIDIHALLLGQQCWQCCKLKVRRLIASAISEGRGGK